MEQNKGKIEQRVLQVKPTSTRFSINNFNTSEDQIKSKLLVFGAVSTTIDDQECQHVTGRFESIRMLLNKSARWPTFVQSHLSVKTVIKKQLPLNLATYRKGEN